MAQLSGRVQGGRTCPVGARRIEETCYGEGLQGEDCPRYPRLGARLGAVTATDSTTGRTERADDRVGRRGLWGDGRLRRADRDADDAPHRRGWYPLLELPHHRPVLADPGEP